MGRKYKSATAQKIKGYFLFFILLANFLLSSFKHYGSWTLSEDGVRALKTYIRVWGLVKYYSPLSNLYDCDSTFLNDISLVENSEKAETILANRIRKLLLTHAEVTQYPQYPINYDTILILNKGFEELIEFKNLGSQERNTIKKIITHRQIGDNKYFDKDPGNKIARFNNELFHTKDLYPSFSLRLLALARYWNIVAYFYPYKYLNDTQPWDDVLDTLIPKFTQAKDAKDYYYCLAEMISKIGDSHAGLQQGDNYQPFGNHLTPVVAELINDKLIITDILFSDDSLKLEVGDEIMAINEIGIKHLLDLQRPYLKGSNDAHFNRLVGARLLSGKDSTVTLKIRNKGDMLLKRYVGRDIMAKMQDAPKKRKRKAYYMLPDQNIGFADLSLIQKSDVKELMKLFMNTDGIIVDLRSYPTMGIWEEFSEYFSDKRVKFYNYFIPNYDLYGTFKLKETGRSFLGKDRQSPKYKGLIMVLVDETTQSRGEFCAMAFQTFPNTIVVGRRTAGTDGDVTQVKLPGGYTTWITGAGVYYPDGRQTQKVGIAPDVYVEKSIQEIKEGRDEILRIATNYIKDANKN